MDEEERAAEEEEELGIVMYKDEDGRREGWEAAIAWLSTLPRRRNVMLEEVEAWVDSNKDHLPRHIITMPRGPLFRYLLAQHKLIRRAKEGEKVELVEPPTPRFQRSDKWKPIYTWLESLDTTHVIGAKSIYEFLENNLALKSELESKHSRHRLLQYIQKCHAAILKKREKQRADETAVDQQQKCSQRKVKKQSNGFIDHAQSQHIHTTNMQMLALKERPVTVDQTVLDQACGPILDKSEASRRYAILTELQNQLCQIIALSREQITGSCVMHDGPVLTDRPSTSAGPFASMQSHVFQIRPGSSRNASAGLVNGLASPTTEELDKRTRQLDALESKTKKKRKKVKENMNKIVPFWSHSEVPSVDVREQSSSNGDKVTPSNGTEWHSASNIAVCLKDRETGAGIGAMPHAFKMVGRRSFHRWRPFLEGWNSLEKRFLSGAVLLQQKAYSAWLPCYSAYTSSVAVAAPLGMMEQGVQKVLDVRFHPQGLPQLVCSSNAAPNELLLYNLESGRTTELAGHNCQIQAVEYATNGERIVSCGSNLVKIWDSTSGTCLHTLGPTPGFENLTGHKRKIHAMAVNPSQSCIVATSGGKGDGQLLLWNVQAGKLVHDLNSSLREKHAVLPCIDAMEFCNQNLLICGSDSASGAPAVVQLWDADAAQACTSFPAHNSYITCLRTNPSGNTLMTGAGDGTVALFDIRSCGGIARLPLGSSCEITSVSFSSCGIYFQASSTANRTLVWDTRMLPMDPGPMPSRSPLKLVYGASCKMKALHCLSHGTPMPTSENAGALPGFVDVGDEGINDARWFHDVAMLVTVSGNGSIAMWDVSLGQPCVRHLISHSRCINTVAIAPNDQHICSGGDDQKVMLYQCKREKLTSTWRLTHPLFEDLQPV